MNLYRVISEELSVVVPILDDGTGPTEEGCIACLIAAESAPSAKWAAWKTDIGRQSFGTFCGDAREMPKFTAKLVAKGMDIPAGDYSRNPAFQSYWEDDSDVPPLTLEQGKATGRLGVVVYPSDPEPPHPPSTDPDDETPEPEPKESD
jgi:hypothetical protein